MQMHSYVYIGGKYIGNGFALSEEQMRPNRLQAKLQAANARMDCHEDCGSLAPAEERQRLAGMVAQPLALLGWNGCPCTNIARTRFESMGACYLQQVGRLSSISPRSRLDLPSISPRPPRSRRSSRSPLSPRDLPAGLADRHGAPVQAPAVRLRQASPLVRLHRRQVRRRWLRPRAGPHGADRLRGGSPRRGHQPPVPAGGRPEPPRQASAVVHAVQRRIDHRVGAHGLV